MSKFFWGWCVRINTTIILDNVHHLEFLQAQRFETVFVTREFEKISRIETWNRSLYHTPISSLKSQRTMVYFTFKWMEANSKCKKHVCTHKEILWINFILVNQRTQMMCNTWDYWVFRHCPQGILQNTTLWKLDPFPSSEERVNLNHCTSSDYWTQYSRHLPLFQVRMKHVL